MTGLNSDHSTGVFHIRFSAIWSGVFFVCAVLLARLAAAYLKHHEVMANCDCITITIPTRTADLLSYLFSGLTPFAVAGLGVAACSVMRFPALASFRTQGTFKEALYAGNDLPPQKSFCGSRRWCLSCCFFSRPITT